MMKYEDKPHVAREYLLVLLLYVMITLASFWPSFVDAARTVTCAEGDCYFFLWDLWWVSYSSFSLHATPYFTNLLFYPTGASMVAQTISPFASWISYPLQWISLPAAYNFVFLLGFALSGVTAYALVKHIVKDKYASFVGGLIFAFSPIHVAHAFAGHLNWVGMEFVPLFVLSFLLLLERRRYSYAIAASVSFLFIIFAGDPELGILSAVFIAALLYFQSYLKGFGKTFDKKMVLSILLPSSCRFSTG